MAKSILDILIKISKQGDGNDKTVKGLVQLKASITDAAAVAGTLVAAGYMLKKGFDVTAGASVELANEIQAIKEVTGLTAEESSKLVQIVDDLKISQEDLYKVMQKNGDQYDFSIAGLGGMSDEYLALGTSQEKAAFMQERFGKSWGDFVKLMEQGSGQITAAGDEINKALIFDEKGLNSVRQYELALDDWNDSVLALKVSIGNQLLPTMTSLLKIQDDGARAAELAAEKGIDLASSSRNVQRHFLELAQAERESQIALVENTTAMDQARVSAEELSKANSGLIDSAIKITQRNKDYQASQEEILVKMSELKSKKDNYYSWEIEKINDTQQEIDEWGVKYEENAAQFVEAMQTKFSMMAIEKIAMLDGVEGFSQAEYEKARAILETQDIATAAAFEEQQAMEMLTDAIANGTIPNVETFGSILDQVTANGVVSVGEVTAALSEIPGETNANINIHTTHTNSYQNDVGSYYSGLNQGDGYAEGTKGWETVPPGYANDSFPIWLESGEQFAVIPAGGNGSNVGVSAATGGGGGTIFNINIVNQSLVNTASREEAKRNLIPLIEDAYRSMQSRGVVRV